MTNEPTAATAVAAHRAPVIEFDAVIKRYAPPPGAPRSDRPAVDSFSATVPSGSTTVLLGSSGCGKTTLLRMVNRMVEPTGGRILLDGEDVLTRDPVGLHRSIGYVMQNAGLTTNDFFGTGIDNQLDEDTMVSHERILWSHMRGYYGLIREDTMVSHERILWSHMRGYYGLT